MYNVTEEYKFTINGRPRPKERPRHTIGRIEMLGSAVYRIFASNNRLTFQQFMVQFREIIKRFNKGSDATIYTPKATQEYEELVALTALGALKGRGKISDKMMIIELNLYFADRRVGDVDNYTKSILDGLHAIFEDDKQVKKTIVEKFISLDENDNPIKKINERVDVVIQVLDQDIYYTPKDPTKKLLKNLKKRNEKFVNKK